MSKGIQYEGKKWKTKNWESWDYERGIRYHHGVKLGTSFKISTFKKKNLHPQSE